MAIIGPDNNELKKLIQSHSQANKLRQAFAALAQAKIPFVNNIELCKTVIENAYNADKFGKAFAALTQAQIPFVNNPALCKTVIENAKHVDKLEGTFVALTKAHISYADNPNLYQAIIENADYADKLGRAFVALTQAHIPFADNPELCQTIINNFDYADNLEGAFAALAQAHIPFVDNPALCQTVIQNADYADKLGRAFAALTQAHIPFVDNPALCQTVIENADYADKLAIAFTALTQAHIPFADNPALCQAVIKNADYANKLERAFAALAQVHISYANNPALCQTVIENTYYADKFERAFAALIQAHIPFTNNHALCQSVINNAYYAHKLEPTFAELTQVNISLANNPALCQTLIENAKHADRLAPALVALEQAQVPYANNKALYHNIIERVNDTEHVGNTLAEMAASGISYLNHPEFFNENILLNHDKMVIHVLTELRNAGYTLNADQNVFKALLSLLNQEQAKYQVAITLLEQVCRFSKENSLCKIDEPGYAQQLAQIDNLIASQSSEIETLTLGPLHKSEATIAIEALLEQISDKQIFDNTRFTYRDEHYYIKLPNQNELNLSLLIKNANLSHLTLSEALISSIGDIVKDIVISWDTSSNNPIVKLLPFAQRAAINLYTGHAYKNMNLLFRSEPLELSEPKWIVVKDINKIISTNFLLGCLLNDAANKINVLPEQTSEKTLLNIIGNQYQIDFNHYINAPQRLNELLQSCTDEGSITKNQQDELTQKLRVYYPKDCVYDRKEELSEEVKARRRANAWCFGAITSFSSFKEGTQYINNRKYVHTKLENGRGYNINHSEAEVLYPHGVQVITKQVSPDYFVSTMVCSPSLARDNRYWSDVALKYAWDNHLSKAYLEGQNEITLNNVRIFRPNHGLAHTHRVILCTDYVTDYFAHYAMDEEFKAFCQSLTDMDREWLRIAAAFSVTGRESEIAATEDLEKYGRYRKASADNLLTFIDTTPLAADKAMRERIYDIVHYMGHPDYETKINQHPDDAERKRRNFLNRMLSTAHKIDLARCYNAKEFAHCMQYYQALSAPSPEQQKALNALIQYHIQLIKAHGNKLSCHMQWDGELVDAQIEYKDIFAQVSRSIKRLNEVTDTVTRPQVTLPFQFEVRNKSNEEDFSHKRKSTDQGGKVKRQRRMHVISKREMQSLDVGKINAKRNIQADTNINKKRRIRT